MVLDVEICVLNYKYMLGTRGILNEESLFANRFNRVPLRDD